MARPDGRAPEELRPVTLTRNWSIHPEGSVLVEFGRTRVLCTASVTEGVPRWRKGSGLGWVTAEYAMLPRATTTRSDRESIKGRVGGRVRDAGPFPAGRAGPGMKIVLATRNAKKLVELQRILSGVSLVGLDDAYPEVPETGLTFAENALIKARAAVAHTGLPSVADD